MAVGRLGIVRHLPTPAVAAQLDDILVDLAQARGADRFAAGQGAGDGSRVRSAVLRGMREAGGGRGLGGANGVQSLAFDAC